MHSLIKLAAVAVILLAPSAVVAAPIVHMSDFIPDGTRTHFNDFETLPNTSNYTNSYSNGGITVTQVAGVPGNLWTACVSCSAHQGTRSWYPNGGDRGYTQITRTDGLDFVNMGLLAGNGFDIAGYYTYDLRLDGVQVLFGSFTAFGNLSRL